MQKQWIALLVLVLAVSWSVGCSDVYFDVSGDVQIPGLTRVPVEEPVVNIPRSLRVWNYAGGSCVHASTEAFINWVNQLELSKWWRKNYSGGESFNGLTDKLRRNHIPYHATNTGDVAHLDWCIAARRGAIIFYYPNHSILLVHMDAKKAIVLDNNRIDSFISIPRETFIQNWKHFGGVAVTLMIGEPAPPIPWVEGS